MQRQESRVKTLATPNRDCTLPHQVRRDLCSPRVLVMEWINGIRCTDPGGVRASGIDVNEFIRNGVVSALRQLLEVSSAETVPDLVILQMFCLFTALDPAFPHVW